MRDEHDLSAMKSRRNPYAAKLGRQITISLGDDVVGPRGTKSEVETSSWDAANSLKTPEDMASHLEAALEDRDDVVIAMVLGTLVRARGVAWVAEKVGVTCESLSKSLSANGNPEFATVLQVIAALGLKLHVSPVSDTEMV